MLYSPTICCTQPTYIIIIYNQVIFICCISWIFLLCNMLVSYITYLVTCNITCYIWKTQFEPYLTPGPQAAQDPLFACWWLPCGLTWGDVPEQSWLLKLQRTPALLSCVIITKVVHNIKCMFLNISQPYRYFCCVPPSFSGSSPAPK